MTANEKTEITALQGEVKDIQSDIEKIKVDIHAFKNSVTPLGPKMEMIIQAIIGSSLTGDGGIARRLEMLEKEIKSVSSRVYSDEKTISSRLDNIERSAIPNETRLKMLWWILGIIVGALVTYIFFVIFYKRQ